MEARHAGKHRTKTAARDPGTPYATHHAKPDLPRQSWHGELRMVSPELSGTHQGLREMAPERYFFGSYFCWDIRRWASSAETSSTWVATVHWCPKGSIRVPLRSP